MKSNFFWSFCLLRKDQRRALSALYDFCRILDDIVDERFCATKAKEELDRWKGIVDRLSCLKDCDPEVAHRLSWACQNFPMDMSDLHWIVEGVETDLEKNRYEDFAELLTYCDGVASSVGLACLAIFGADRQKSYNYALATGRALQLTNILRDLRRDGQRGRIYLPRKDLRRFAYSEEDLLASAYNDHFVHLMEFEVNRVKAFYDASKASLSPQERRTVPAAEMMRNTYQMLLDQIEARKYNVFARKVALSPWNKFQIMVSIVRTRVSGEP